MIENGYAVRKQRGFLYAEGTVPVLLVAHLDTVHRTQPETICYSADGTVMMSPQGIGGDDRAGVYMIYLLYTSAWNGYAVVRGKHPRAKGKLGDILAFAREAVNGPKIEHLSLCVIDGKERLPDVWYDDNFKECEAA